MRMKRFFFRVFSVQSTAYRLGKRWPLGEKVESVATLHVATWNSMQHALSGRRI